MTTFARQGRRTASEGVGSIGFVALRCIVLIALALALILVVLPAVVGAAGVQVGAAV